jgi:hypothetical protein
VHGKLEPHEEGVRDRLAKFAEASGTIFNKRKQHRIERPMLVEDAARAVRFARERSPQWGGDPGGWC